MTKSAPIKLEEKNKERHKSKRIIIRSDNREGGEETEIAAHVHLPHDGGWGWVVVFSAFVNIFILDGVAYTFGSLLHDIAQDLQVSDSLVVLMNSIAVAVYFIASPVASALINRYGFRECAMTGSIICSFSLLTSYFSKTFPVLCIFYGPIAGFGYSLINLSSGLVVGFYFQKLRSVALAIATCGSSFGVMILFPINTFLVQLGGWRTTTLLHCGLLGLIFFLSMAFRPLLSLAVINAEDMTTCTITYLPSVMSNISRIPSIQTKTSPVLTPSATEKIFKAHSNINFPTASAFAGSLTPAEPGPSAANVSKLTLVTIKPQTSITPQQMKQVQSMISGDSTQPAKTKQNVGIAIQVHQPKKLKWWQRLFHWEPHAEHARPMYRDDVFYEGKLEDLPVYQKSTTEPTGETTERSTGLEYNLAVTRTATTQDLRDTKGIFTTSVRRVLATMMDPGLLKKCSFLLLCSSGFLTYLGFLVPYVYIKDRNLLQGIDPQHCNFFISVLGFSNAMGRLVLGSLASRVDPILLFSSSCAIAGLSTIFSSVTYNVYYQYCYVAVFGFFISSVACLRSLILVSLYGLDKLTNATGMMLIFLGLGNLISTPLAAVIKNYYGFKAAFYVAGIFITLSGFILVPIKKISQKENTNNSTYNTVY